MSSQFIWKSSWGSAIKLYLGTTVGQTLHLSVAYGKKLERCKQNTWHFTETKWFSNSSKQILIPSCEQLFRDWSKKGLPLEGLQEAVLH